MSRRAAALLAAWMLAAGHATAGPYDPSLRFQTLTTAHFRIHYHRGAAAMAARLSVIAEETHARLSQAWAVSGDRLTHVVLVDQTDASNGAAAVVPWNAIVIYPVPPTGAETIGNTDDWLEYVFVHEYAHVVHLDRSVGWARVARAVFGRTEIAFPNLTMPLWQIEGFATLVESERGGGRLHAGDFRDVVDVAARAGRLEPLDRVNGGLVDWPSGQGWYAYGARFHRFLVERYGVERLRELSARSAGELPFLTSLAFRRVYGKSLGELWTEFRAGVAVAHDAMPPGDVRQVTWLGYLVDGPRSDATGAVYFTAVDAHRFPGIYRLAPGETTPSRVVSRYGGSALDVRAGALLFDQLEIARGAALTSDLYLHDERSGATRRLTRDARLMMAERSPDGTRIAAIQVVAGARALVVLDAARLIGPAADPMSPPVIARTGDGNAVYANPRWSPDGRLLAVERRLRGSESTIVLLDPTTLNEVGVIAGGVLDRLASPAWSPDGSSLYYAQAVDERPFQLRVVGVGPSGCVSTPRALTAVEGGAREPLVRPDGSIVFVGYTNRGHDLFTLTPSWAAPTPVGCDSPPPSARSDRPVQPAEPLESKPPAPYRPWSTLAPRGWLPIVEESEGRWRLGASVIGIDVIQRHVVSAAATWAVTTGDVSSDQAPRTRPDWSAAYTYQRWQPSLYIAAQDRTSLFQAVMASGTLVPVAQREQTVDAGIWRPIRRIRWTQSVLAAYHVERLTTDVPAATDRLTRAGLRSAWTFTSARRYGHSISQEDGMTLAVTGETLGSAFGSDGRSDAVTTDVRAYLPIGIPHGVAAVRAGFAASRGDRRVQRRFRLGGSGGDPVAGGFGSDAISLLRGFPDEVFVGDRVALVNLEARVPLFSIQRGWGTWPIFLRTVHATGFADVGNAWNGRVRWAERKIGYGAELSADVMAAFGLPLTLTAGIGWGEDGAGVVTGAREIYFRVGRSF